MKPANSKVFEGVTEQKMDGIRNLARIQGVDMKADKGQVDYDKCQIAYEFDKEDELLTVTPSLPFYVTENEFWGYFTIWLGLIPA